MGGEEGAALELADAEEGGQEEQAGPGTLFERWTGCPLAGEVETGKGREGSEVCVWRRKKN